MMTILITCIFLLATSFYFLSRKNIQVFDFYYIGMIVFYGLYSIFYFTFNIDSNVYLFDPYLYISFILINLFFFRKLLSSTLSISSISFNELFNLVKKDAVNKKNFLYVLFFITFVAICCVSIASHFTWVKFIYQEFDTRISSYYLYIIKACLLLLYSLFFILFVAGKKNYLFIFVLLTLLLLVTNYGRREFLYFITLYLLLASSFTYQNLLIFFKKNTKKVFFILCLILIFIFSYAEIRYQVRNTADSSTSQLSSIESTINRNANIIFDSYIHDQFEQGADSLKGIYFYKSFINFIPSILYISKDSTFTQENFLKDYFNIDMIGSAKTDFPLSIHIGSFIDFGFFLGGFYTLFLLFIISIPIFLKSNSFIKTYSFISISHYFFHIERIYADFLTFYATYAIGISLIFLSSFFYAFIKPSQYAR